MAKKDQTEDDTLDIDVATDAEANAAIAETVAVAVDGADAVEADWKAQFEGAQKQLDEANAKRADAERLAKQHADELERTQRENAKARSEVVSAEMMAVNNAIANTEHERNDAKQAYKAAMEAGDYEAAAEAQAKLSEVAVKAQRIKEGKAELERRADAAKNQPDPLDQAVANMSPRSAAWVRSHPEVIRDASKRHALEMAHYRVLGSGIVSESDDYYKQMDVEMGYAARPAAQDVDVDVDPPQRQPTAPAAPVSRGSAALASSPRGNVVKLTAAEREIAAACGMTDAEYAKNKLAIARENATTH